MYIIIELNIDAKITKRGYYFFFIIADNNILLEYRELT